MGETTETNDAGTRRPLKIGAPLLAVSGAFWGGILGATASGNVVSAFPQESGRILAAILALVVAVVGYRVGTRIDRRRYAVDGGWRGLLLVVGTFVGFGSGLALLTSRSLVAPAVGAFIGCAGLFVGAVAGVRLGEAFDRRRALAEELSDADDPP